MIIVPALDEEPTIVYLADEIAAAMDGQRWTWELVFVDDGSGDGSWATMTALAEARKEVRAVRLRRNFGKSAALAVGLAASRGRLVATLDADLQDDPSELPRLLEVIEAGEADLVVGWKQHRRDPLRKRLPSKLFNRVTALVSGVHLDDFNTGYKVGRRAVFADVPLYGELHRFVPVFAHDLGHRVVQRPVNHRPRVAGASKFGYERFLRGLLDLLAALVATRFRRRPGHLFGGLGVAMLAMGSLGLLYLFVFSLFSSDPIGTRPLLQASVLVVVLGVQLISIGLLAELVVSRSPREEARLFIAERTDESGW